MNQLVRYVPDADLRLGYTGLNKLVPLTNLGKGEFVAFVNRAQTKVKLATQNDMIAYYRHSRGRLDPRVIRHLPEYFNGSEIDYNAAVTKMIRRSFPKFFAKETEEK